MLGILPCFNLSICLTVYVLEVPHQDTNGFSDWNSPPKTLLVTNIWHQLYQSVSGPRGTSGTCDQGVQARGNAFRTMEPQVLKREWSIASSMQCEIETVLYYKISVRVKISFDSSYDAKILP